MIILSVIIVTYRSVAEIGAAVASLPNSLMGKPVEVVIVDNSLDVDGTFDAVRRVRETVVFGGMRAVLSRFRPKLIVELHPQLTGSDPIKNIIRVLEEEYGYGVDLVVDRELDYAHLKRRMTSLDFERLRHEDWRFRCFTVFMSFRRTELNT